MKQNTGDNVKKPSKPTVLLDVHGVLVDFISHMRIVVNYYEPITRYDLPKQCGMSYALFWDKIHALGSKFWEHLPLHPWAYELVNMMLDDRFDWRICTTPTDDTRSKIGTKALLDRHDLHGTLPTLYTRDKSKYANPHTLLIDDNEKVIDHFIAAGGWGFLWPQPWNSNDDSVEFVLNQGLRSFINQWLDCKESK